MGHTRWPSAWAAYAATHPYHGSPCPLRRSPRGGTARADRAATRPRDPRCRRRVRRFAVVLRAHHPDVAILDAGALESGRGASASAAIRGRDSCCSAMTPRRVECAQLLAFGASACLGTGTQSRDVLNAIHLASRGSGEPAPAVRRSGGWQPAAALLTPARGGGASAASAWATRTPRSRSPCRSESRRFAPTPATSTESSAFSSRRELPPADRRPSPFRGTPAHRASSRSFGGCRAPAATVRGLLRLRLGPARSIVGRKYYDGFRLTHSGPANRR